MATQKDVDGGSGGGSGQKEVEVFRVGVRVPPFYPDAPDLWFAQIESQFVLSNISNDDTKFHYIQAQLEHQYAMEVKDIIIKPPTTNKYETLKNELIKRLSASKEKKVKQLLMLEELGDRKPSQFLRHLQDLAGDGVPEDFMRTLWVNRLPANLQVAVASQQDIELTKLADLADKVHDAVNMAPRMANTAMIGTSTSALQTLTKQIAELALEVAAIKNRGDQNRSRSRSRGREFSPRARSRSRARNDDWCWYHNRFGAKAYKCTKPCKYDDGASGNYSGSRN